MEIFKDYAYYYNLFYQDKDYKSEAAQINCLLKRYDEGINRIINFGCGTGKHDIEFTKIGYQCTGVDLSPRMIDIARENAKKEKTNINFLVKDIRDFESGDQYDAVISLFHVMSYQNNNQDVQMVFRSARKVLGAGGLFLFDVWYGPGVLTDKPTLRVKEIENEKNRLIRIARPVLYDKEDVVDICYEIFVLDKESGKTKVINEVHHMRYFFRPELELLLKEAGFELVDNLDCKTLGETDYNSWTSYFIARAV